MSGEKVTGTVKWFNAMKGFGYITFEEEDYFCHQSDINATGFRALTEGATVEFEKSTDETRDNKLRALKVTGPDGAEITPPPRKGKGKGRKGGKGKGKGKGGSSPKKSADAGEA